MLVTGVRRTGQPHPHVRAIFPPERRAEAAHDADFVVVAAPLTTETQGFIDAAFLGAMRDDAWLINVGRAGVVNEDDLYAALVAKQIGGAALDVHWVEPIPSDSRWWSAPNAIITPHRASSTDKQGAELLRLLKINFQRFRAGEPLENAVDLSAGY